MSDSTILLGGAAAPPDTTNPVMVGACLPGTPLYASGNGVASPARANGASAAYPIGLALHAAADGERTFCKYAGLVVLTSAQWTAVLDTGTVLEYGKPYYVSAATAGKLTKTAPSEGSYVACVGIAMSTHALLVQIGLAELAGT